MLFLQLERPDGGASVGWVFDLGDEHRERGRQGAAASHDDGDVLLSVDEIYLCARES
jgi:hypothetical protein